MQYTTPASEAISARRALPRGPLQVANGTRLMPGPQVISESFADDVRAAWLALIPGQFIPMLGERVEDDQSSLNE